MNPIFRMTIAVISVFILTACHTTNHLSYLQTLGESREGTLAASDYSIRIAPADELQIVVTSVVPMATVEYNLPSTNTTYTSGSNSVTTSPTQQSYTVDSEGCIIFPVLGKIHVAGETTAQVREKLTRLIGERVKDPQVLVKLINFKVNVMGEVRNPHTVYVGSERFSIFDALAAAGDLTEYGRRDNVTIIREDGDSLLYTRLDLRDAGITSSPYFYLRQNDVVIVEPNTIRQSNSKYNQNNAFKLSVISTIVSAVSVIASLVIALAVR